MVGDLLAALVRGFVGAHARCLDPSVFDGPKVYFANHTSHLDFIVIWASLPARQRRLCVPVAAKDYWSAGPLRRRLAKASGALLIERKPVSARDDPVGPMADVLHDGRSLIVFPEGTRSPDGAMKPFKGGLHHLAKRAGDVELVPVALGNLNRILPKGELLPVPLICRIVFGRPMRLREDEERPDFLERAFDAVKELMIDGV